MTEKVAIIMDAHVGVRDAGGAMLWWTAEVHDGGHVLQCFYGEDMLQRINEAQCYKVEDLNGKPIIVEVDRNSVKFLRFWTVKP
jgi:hypothetical protein